MSPEKENGEFFVAVNNPLTNCKDSLNLLRGFAISSPNGVKFIGSPVPSPRNVLPFEIWLSVKAECAMVAGCRLDVSTTDCPIAQRLVFVANAVSTENDSNTGALPGIIK